MSVSHFAEHVAITAGVGEKTAEVFAASPNAKEGCANVAASSSELSTLSWPRVVATLKTSWSHKRVVDTLALGDEGGADGVWCPVTLTADKELVVFAELYTPTGKLVSTLTRDQLASEFKTVAPDTFPTLRDFLQHPGIAKANLSFVFDARHPDVVQPMMRELSNLLNTSNNNEADTGAGNEAEEPESNPSTRRWTSGRFLFTSLQQHHVVEAQVMRRILPNLSNMRIGFTIDANPHDVLDSIVPLAPDFVAMNKGSLTEAWADAAKAHNLPVVAWSINLFPEAVRMMKVLHCVSILSDVPSRVKGYADACHHAKEEEKAEVSAPSSSSSSSPSSSSTSSGMAQFGAPTHPRSVIHHQFTPYHHQQQQSSSSSSPSSSSPSSYSSSSPDTTLTAMAIGHRGAKGFHPDNTMPSFHFAIAHGTRMLELDIGILIDGQLVIYHDPFAMLASGDAMRVRDCTLAELQQLSPGTMLFADLLADERVKTSGVHLYLDLKDERVVPPLLAALAAACDADTGCAIGVNDAPIASDDLTPSAAASTPDRVIPFWTSTRFSVASFDHVQVAEAIALVKTAMSPSSSSASSSSTSSHPLQSLTHLGFGIIIDGLPLRLAQPFQELGVDFISVGRGSVTPLFIQDAHDRGLAFYSWTVNSHAELQSFPQIGVDGLCTDYPDSRAHHHVLTPTTTPAWLRSTPPHMRTSHTMMARLVEDMKQCSWWDDFSHHVSGSRGEGSNAVDADSDEEAFGQLPAAWRKAQAVFPFLTTSTTTMMTTSNA